MIVITIYDFSLFSIPLGIENIWLGKYLLKICAD